MPLYTLKHGLKFDTVSRREMEELLRRFQTRQETRERVRAGATIILDAAGVGQDEVYQVPMGFEFEVRRVQLELSDVGESNLPAGVLSLGTAATSLQYLRSGTRIEWGFPVSPVASSPGRVPGIQTWGDQQGPFLGNGEVFEVRAVFPTKPNVTLTVLVEGILTKAGSLK